MKNLQLKTLLIVLCATTLQITAQTNDSLKVAPTQVGNIYKGLKQGEICKTDLKNCLDTANSLNDIIQQQNDSLQANAAKLIKTNGDLKTANKNYTDKSVELQALKDKTIPWWKAGGYGVVIGFLLKLLL